MTEQTLTGRCGCGAVTYRAKDPVREPAVCHCRSCRQSSGAPFLVWFSVAVENLEIDGELSEYHSSELVTRTRCARCGTPMTYANRDRPAEVDVVHATLDEPQLLPPGYHIWLKDKPEWVGIGDDLPQYDEWRYS